MSDKSKEVKQNAKGGSAVKPKKNAWYVAVTAMFCAVFIVLGGWLALRTPDEISGSERRELAKWPSLSWESVMNGKYFDAIEDYSLDQFPMRETFRRVKSLWKFYVMREKENNGIVIHDGTAAALTSLTDKSIEVYIKRLNSLCENYFDGENVNVYTTIIPDKMKYMASAVGCSSIDYDALEALVRSQVRADYIDIFGTLSLDDYYKTDTHWKQECIIGTANTLLSAMGRQGRTDYTRQTPLSPFYGVYYGQSALPLSPDEIICLTSPTLAKARAWRADKTTGEMGEAKVYYHENIAASDAYDVYLGGAGTVTVLERDEAVTGKTLYLLGDSYGRSLAPLLLEGYDRVVMFDIRYIRMSQALEKVPLEEGSDVLMAYSILAIQVSSNLQVK